MEIIIRGKVPTRFVVKDTCINCKSLLQVDIEKDCKGKYGNGEYGKILRTPGDYDLHFLDRYDYTCPVCNTLNKIYPEFIKYQDYKKYDEPDDDDEYI